MKMELIISKINPEQFIESQKIISGSFRTVAQDFGLTEANCPSNAAFITIDKLYQLKEKGVSMYGLFQDSKQIGFVGIEEAKDDIYYMETLAVLPEYRHLGYGKKLMDFVRDEVRKKGGKRLGIGIIDENKVLKKWYANYGFCETGIKKFDHLPFTVCFMEMEMK